MPLYILTIYGGILMKKKQILSLALVFVLMLTLFAGCKKSSGEDEWISEVVYETVPDDVENGGNGTASGSKTGSKTGNKTGSKTGSSSNTANPLKYNLGGKTINIYSVSDEKNVNASESKSNAAKVKMFEKLEKQLNCKIVYTTFEAQQLYQQVLLKVASGSYFADLIDARIYTAEGFIASGFTKNLAKISTVDLSKKYMNVADSVNGFQFGTGNYAIAEPLSNSSISNFLFVNKRILKEITGNDNYVYDLMSKKQWNISNFRDLAKKAVKDLDGVSGLTKADRAGIIQLDIGTSAYSSVFETLGVEMVKKNNGKVVYNMQDSSVMSAINLAYDIYVKDGTTVQANDNECVDLFRTGHGLFYGGCYLSQLPAISDMDDEFGVVPYPAKDGSSKYSMPVNWNFNSLMIPSSLNDKQTKDAGAFLQAYCYVAQDVKKAKYDEYMSRYLCDKQSRNNLDTCYDAMRLTVSAVICNNSLPDIFNGTYKVLYASASGENASTLIQSTSKVAIAGIEDLNKKFK